MVREPESEITFPEIFFTIAYVAVFIAALCMVFKHYFGVMPWE